MTENDVYEMDCHRRSSICTYTGVEFFPLDPRPEDVRIRDIAHALAMRVRYAGHCHQFYSIAEHCVLVSLYCSMRWPDSPEFARAALMHDAAEAYLADVNGPVKRDPRFGKWWYPIEDKLEAVLADVFGTLYPLPPEVKYADKELLKMEMPAIMQQTDWWSLKEPDDVARQLPVQCWWYPIAESKFMHRFRILFQGAEV